MGVGMEKSGGGDGAGVSLNGSLVDHGGEQHVVGERLDPSCVGTVRNGMGSPLMNSSDGSPLEDGGFKLDQRVGEGEGLGNSGRGDEVRPEVNNGSSVIENAVGDSSGRDSIDSSNSKVNEAKKLAASPSGTRGSPPLDSGSTPTTKGYGLKKWRRIKRDAVKDGKSGADHSRALKRGLSIAGEATKVRGGSLSENQQKSEILAASPSPLAGNSGLEFSSLPLGTLDSDSTLALISGFSAGTDSDNSEDKSNRALSARNKLKQKLEISTATGNSKERSKVKNPGVKIHENSANKGRDGKGKVESSKKCREEKNFLEKENSYSSVESDVRNLDSYYHHFFSSVQNNDQKQSEKYASDQENDSFAQSFGQQFGEGAQTDYSRNKMEVFKDWGGLAATILKEVNKKEIRNSRPKGANPLSESVVLLESVQEALDKEIQSFKEIGKDKQLDGNDCSLYGDNINTSARAQELNPLRQLHFEEMEGSSSTPVDTEIAGLFQRVSPLEHPLEEKEEVIKDKEAKLIELELISNKQQSPKDENDYIVNAASKINEAMEAEFEELFKKRVEAEIEYVVLTKTTQMLKVDQLSLLGEQMSLAEEQAQLIQKLEDTKGKASMLKLEAEKVEASSRELLSAKEALKLQNKICKLSVLWFFQAVLLYLVALSWFMQLIHQSPEDFVPT